MPGRLVLCATPIGNLGDASRRLAETLASSDVVYAEDTRRTRTLLDHLGVDTPLRSYFVGNEAARAEELAARVSAGEQVALVTDAGSPAVADPGVSAVRAVRAVGGEVSVVPGPSAVMAALTVSGLGADRFTFEGFLPRRGGERARRLGAIATCDHTVVFFTTGPRLVADLAALAGLGPDREVVVCRELTKAFEEVWVGTLAAAPGHWEGATRKGEFTVVVAASPTTPGAVDLDTALGIARERVEAGGRRSEVARDVAKETGVDRGALYDGLARSSTQD